MKKRGLKGILLTVVVTTLTIALCGCAGGKAGNSSEITIGIPQDIDGLDPHDAVAAGTKEVLFNVFEGLVKPDSDGNLVPAVAESYELSEDGSKITFKIRKNVKFHDGSTVTAEDVKYSLDKCADAGSGAPLVPAFSNIASVNIVDADTVEVVLVQPDTGFISYMTSAITPAANADKEDTDPIGTGPYKYVSWAPQESFVVEKFNDYWGTPANIENVTFKICANPDTLVTDLEGGSIDMVARLTSAQAAELAQNPDFEVLEGTMNLVQALYLNNQTAPFDDVRVRQALCYAVDAQEIMDYVSDGKGTKIGSSMFPAFGKYYMEELNDTYTKDLDKAKELLKEAGYEDGFTFTIKVPSNYTQHVDTAQVIEQQLKEIGVTAKIELIEWDTWLSDVYSGRKFDATVIGVDASSLTADALLSRFESSASNNFINFNDADYDKAYANALASTNDEEKTGFYKECEVILNKQAANVYIQDLPEFVGINKKYTGYTFYPLYVQDIAKLSIAK